MRRLSQLDAVMTRLGTIEAVSIVSIDTVVARIAGEVIAARVSQSTINETALEREISTLVAPLAPQLLGVGGGGALTAARSSARPPTSTASARPMRTPATTEPPPRQGPPEAAQRHRLSRTGNRQLTPHSTASLSPKHAATRAHATSSSVDGPTATAPARPSVSSNDDSPTSSTAPCTPMPDASHESRTPLDTGATDRPIASHPRPEVSDRRHNCAHRSPPRGRARNPGADRFACRDCPHPDASLGRFAAHKGSAPMRGSVRSHF